MTLNYDAAREKMVREQLMSRGIDDPGVLAAMRKVPRHRFVPKGMEEESYDDNPLPIGQGQTISQPYIVALMTQALELAGTEKVLEIGTGCGYQAAVLAELSFQVYTVERIESLLVDAKKTLRELGYDNIFFRASDGTLGWEEHKPYDAVIVTAGAPHVPEPLWKQLADGGRMIIPVGDRYSQELVKITRSGENMIRESLGGCRFVALKGEYGW